MKRLFVYFLVLTWVGSLVACSNDNNGKSKTLGLNCSADYSCSEDLGEVCYNGVCTNKSDVPASEPTGDGGTPDENKPDENKPDENKPDENKPDENKPDENKPDDAPKPTYPEGPYGADVDEVIIPAEFSDCAGGRVKLKDFYKHPKIKVIQLTVHTGWCPSCRVQSQGMESFYQKYKEKGLAIMYILTENTQQGSGQVTPQYCMSHGAKYKFSFTPIRDPGSKVMRKFFDRNAVPLNMIITTNNMKIRYKKSGALPQRMEGIVSSYLE